jgi:hypothetical protein
MGVMANRTAPFSYRCMYAHTIKKLLFFLVTGIALLYLRVVKLKLVIRSMGVMTYYTGAGLNGLMDIGSDKIRIIMTIITKGLPFFL